MPLISHSSVESRLHEYAYDEPGCNGCNAYDEEKQKQCTHPRKCVYKVGKNCVASSLTAYLPLRQPHCNSQQPTIASAGTNANVDNFLIIDGLGPDFYRAPEPKIESHIRLAMAIYIINILMILKNKYKEFEFNPFSYPSSNDAAKN